MSEWISVDDRLPEHSGLVLAVTQEYIMLGRITIPARYIQDREQWLDVDSHVDVDEQWVDAVSHWMPLPEPPTQPER